MPIETFDEMTRPLDTILQQHSFREDCESVDDGLSIVRTFIDDSKRRITYCLEVRDPKIMAADKNGTIRDAEGIPAERLNATSNFKLTVNYFDVEGKKNELYQIGGIGSSTTSEVIDLQLGFDKFHSNLTNLLDN